MRIELDVDTAFTVTVPGKKVVPEPKTLVPSISILRSVITGFSPV